MEYEGVESADISTDEEYPQTDGDSSEYYYGANESSSTSEEVVTLDEEQASESGLVSDEATASDDEATASDDEATASEEVVTSDEEQASESGLVSDEATASDDEAAASDDEATASDDEASNVYIQDGAASVGLFDNIDTNNYTINLPIETHGHYILHTIRNVMMSSTPMYMIGDIIMVKNNTIIPRETVEKVFGNMYLIQDINDMSDLTGVFAVENSPVERMCFADEIEWSDGKKHITHNHFIIHIRKFQTLHVKFGVKRIVGRSNSIPGRIPYMTDNVSTSITIESFGMIPSKDLLVMTCERILYSLDRYRNMFINREGSVRVLVTHVIDPIEHMTVEYVKQPFMYASLIGQHFARLYPYTMATMTYGLDHIITQGMIFRVTNHDSSTTADKLLLDTIDSLVKIYEDIMSKIV